MIGSCVSGESLWTGLSGVLIEMGGASSRKQELVPVKGLMEVYGNMNEETTASV